MKQFGKIVLLSGPTASGKSNLAVKLAKKINGEIINADSMQIYKEFLALTSRPRLIDTKNINHHFYGIYSVNKKFSTGHWLKLVTKKIKDKIKEKKTLIIVGGTGLYFKALTDGLVKIPNIPKKLSYETRELQKRIGQKNFFNKLIKLDKNVEKFISQTDSQRSIRAYEVVKYTKKSLFSFRKNTKSYFDKTMFKKIFINIPKELLHKKIDQRVNEMFKEGAIEEVKFFLKMKINKELSSNKIIGIQEIKHYLDGNMSIEKTKELIKLKTRQYAKRQFTWARGHMKSWEMIYSQDINDLLKKTINKIS